MRNIEIKVAVPSHERLQKLVRQAGARPAGKYAQIDTYFKAPHGRLKLREIDGKRCELIQYFRPNASQRKISTYEIVPLSRSVAKRLKKILGDSLGVIAVVKKVRQLWMYKHTRIHLDTVTGSGKFLELESMIVRGRAQAQQEYDELVELLELEKYQKVWGSYSDLNIQ